MINFPNGVTSWFMMARTEFEHMLVESEKCNLVISLNYVYNIIRLMRMGDSSSVLLL